MNQPSKSVLKKPKPKSAKYKKIERISRKIFYIISFVISLLAIAVLVVSAKTGSGENVLEFTITVNFI